MTVALCIPSGDLMHTDCALSLARMLTQHRDIIILNTRTSLVQVSRYEMVRAALERGASHVLQVDSDLIFPYDALTRLLVHDVPFIGATYMKRRLPFEMVGVPMSEEITSSDIGIIEMKRMPVGFSLISAEIFAKVPKPWFPVTWDAHVEDHTSEDYNFCDQVRAAGYTLWCDLDLSHDLGHIGMYTFKWDRPSHVS